MSIPKLATVIYLAFCIGESQGQARLSAAAVDTYMQSYVRTNNFAGTFSWRRRARFFSRGPMVLPIANIAIENTPATRFHIASMSMQFTAAAVLRLVDKGLIKLDDHVGEFLPGIEGGEKITIRDLLT